MKCYTLSKSWYDAIKDRVKMENPYEYQEHGTDMVEVDVVDEEKFISVSQELGYLLEEDRKVTIEFPCDVGDVVYVIVEGLSIPARRVVNYIMIRKSHDGTREIRFSLVNSRTNEVSVRTLEDFNKTVFTSAYDAKKIMEDMNHE